MADNYVTDAGAGGNTYASDEDGSTIHHPYVKLEFGADNTFTKVSDTDPLPIDVKEINSAAVLLGGGVESGALRVTIANDSSGVVSVDDNGANLSVDWGGTVPPIGAGTEAAALRVTLATDSTGVISVDDNGGDLSVDNAGTFLVQADSVIPGTGATNLGKAVDSASAGTDTGVATLAVRDDALTALTPIDGDYVPLRVNSTGALHVTGGGGGTQFNVDDIAGGTDAGTLALVVRDDALTTLTPIDGDYTQLRVNSTGALHVTGGGGGTEYNEDDVTPAPIIGTASLMERDDALSTLTPVEGDFAALRCSARGALWTQDDNIPAAVALAENLTNPTTPLLGSCLLAFDGTNWDRVQIGGGTEAAALRVTIANDSTGVVSIDDNGANLSVDWGGTVPPIGSGNESAALRVTIATDATLPTVTTVGTVSQVDVISPGSGPLNLGKLEDAAHASGDLGIFVLSVRDDDPPASTANATGDYAALTTDANGRLYTNNGWSADSGSTSTDIGTSMLAVRDDEKAAIGSDADYVQLRTDRFAALRVTQLPDATSEIKYAIIDAASSGDNTIQAAAGAGIKIRVLSVLLISAGTVNTRFESGAAGTALTGQMNLVVNSGFVLPFNPAGWFETADNTLLNLELSAAISVDGCVTYVEV